MSTADGETGAKTVPSAVLPLPSTPEFARRLLEVAPVIVVVLDAEGRILHANRRLLETTGADADDLVGRDAIDRFLSPRWRRVARRMFANVFSGRATGASVLPRPRLWE